MTQINFKLALLKFSNCKLKFNTIIFIKSKISNRNLE